MYLSIVCRGYYVRLNKTLLNYKQINIIKKIVFCAIVKLLQCDGNTINICYCCFYLCYGFYSYFHCPKMYIQLWLLINKIKGIVTCYVVYK